MFLHFNEAVFNQFDNTLRDLPLQKKSLWRDDAT